MLHVYNKPSHQDTFSNKPKVLNITVNQITVGFIQIYSDQNLSMIPHNLLSNNPP